MARCGLRTEALASPRRLLLPIAIEISQVGGRLVLPRRHELSVRAHHVVLLSDLHVVVGLGAGDLAPIGLAIGLAMVALGHDPRARQRMIDHRHFVVENVGIGFVEENPLPDDGQIVLVQGNAAVVVSAGPVEAARLDLQDVVPAVPVRIDPPADGISEVGRFELRGPIASIGIDATIVVDVLHHDVSGARRDDHLQRAVAIGNPRHAW